VKIAEAFVTFRAHFSVKKAVSEAIEQRHPEQLQALRKLIPNLTEHLREEMFAWSEGERMSSGVSRSEIAIDEAKLNEAKAFHEASSRLDNLVSERLQRQKRFPTLAELRLSLEKFAGEEERAHHGWFSWFSARDSNQ
jgi:hypothetical protein